MQVLIGLKPLRMSIKPLIPLVCFLFLFSCYRVPRDIEPKINYTVQDRYLKSLPSPFAPLTPEEKETAWGKEYQIGLAFARDLDLYRAITSFRRAEILAGDHHKKRKLEMKYEILLCYYMGRRYNELVEAYNSSGLSQVTTEFPAFEDLLILLYDSFTQLCECDKAEHILRIIQQHYPAAYKTLRLSSALECADFPVLEEINSCPPERPYLSDFLCHYEANCKSPTTAGLLNAVIPGSGYLYVGQTQTAITAFLVNGLFIAASVHFFRKGPIAAGIITTSFEAGWYFGGIYGASAEAKFYNERLYECNASPLMNREGLFPVFMLKYSF
ncbi:MAG: hypothetical protein KR126chlam1_00816 [Chlamydiae bacterium]|nr:hypothetical protein [Chlamydiota bacterium]